MFVLRFSWVIYVKELVTPLLKFWKCDFNFLGNEPRDDPIYSVNGKSGCYTLWNIILSKFIHGQVKRYGRAASDSNPVQLESKFKDSIFFIEPIFIWSRKIRFKLRPSELSGSKVWIWIQNYLYVFSEKIIKRILCNFRPFV